MGVLIGVAVVLAAGAAWLAWKSAALAARCARLEAECEHERRSAVEKLQLLADSETRLKTEFENLANRILEEKGGALVRQNQSRIGDLLQPFEKQLRVFEERVNAIHTESTKQSSALLEQVRQLQNVSNRVSAEATGLAEAIKGNAKTQGDWGEVIVQRILEASGLREGHEFERQAVLRNDQQSLRRPDFIVHLPGKRSIILDSKVSLTAYERWCNGTDDEERTKALKEHLQSVRRHLHDLDEKEYTDLLGNRTLDFVVLCIPLEPAYQAALQYDPELLYAAANTRVVLTGPATLLITLKLIAQMWRRENEQRNAADIAEQAGRLYDQVRLVLEAAMDAQRRLGGAAESLDDVIKRIGSGRGNLVRRVEMLRKLGAKVKTPLADEITGPAYEEEDEAG